MLSLASPLWLLGWLSLPLVRWLHRFSGGGKTMIVSALFLWPTSSVTRSAERPGIPDPHWRLRALIVLTLFLCLAGPGLEKPGDRIIDVWVDDSLSMQTLENGRTRLDTAFAKLDSALLATGTTRVQMHSLLNPTVQMPWRADTVHHGHEDWPRPRLSDGIEPRPPLVALMTPSHEHWLITDGADPVLDGWANRAPLSRILQVGAASDNVAITQLSVSPTLDGSGAVQALIRVDNLGGRPQTRTLSLSTGDAPPHQEKIQLPPGGQRDLRFELSLPDRHQSLRAALSPADALAMDDTLSITASGWSPPTVSMDDACPDPLKIALRAYPRIRISRTPGMHHDLRIECGNANEAQDGPTLHFHVPRRPQPLSVAPTWSTTPRFVTWPRLRREWLFADAPNARSGEDRPLLASAETPLITVSKTIPRTVNVFLDMAQPLLVRQPEYPALIDGLITSALGRSLLDETFSVTRPVAESRIAPRPLSARNIPASFSHHQRTDLSPLLALLAALLLAGDLLLSARRAVHGSPQYGGI